MSQGNGRGPPDHSNAPEHVKEQSGGTIKVGKNKREKCKEQANCDDQQDRIEAKLDLILDELGVEY